MDKLQINRDYDAFCGTGIAFEYAVKYILEHKDKEQVKIAVISDREVSGYYYNRFNRQFLDLGIETIFVSVDSTDKDKNLLSVDRMIKHLNDFGLGTGDWFVALGGGGVIDVVSFAAAIINCNIKLMYVPTTLNAMGDAALSETGYLNSVGNKNQLSIKVKPDVLIVDPVFLDTVPKKIRSNGYASIIRIAVLYDYSLLIDLKKTNNLREFLDKCYNIRTKIEKINPLLLTMGNELAEAIESYFRFLNYTEGEILALSILATVDKERRDILKAYYKEIGLPVVLEGTDSKLILKLVRERFDKLNCDYINVVDLENGKWTVRRINRTEAVELFEKRIRNICAKEEKE